MQFEPHDLTEEFLKIRVHRESKNGTPSWFFAKHQEEIYTLSTLIEYLQKKYKDSKCVIMLQTCSNLHETNRLSLTFIQSFHLSLSHGSSDSKPAGTNEMGHDRIEEEEKNSTGDTTSPDQKEEPR
mmetsp:Transcript_5898/g.9567  ORF Transcript_5898/g.9567 Transcript_5898/m.9567 type:complete len:126 (-) Transcript_5898:458-835(-)|eukprot:CAMPEP_0170494890 /NCGR_PEP_ID=MMETSP0208-20121228/14897_1 /TAXON_ID=197538 /ORGANISM="Strombidium inclinatum, Strain S3" /LENGTH=125 /DNA_ID=CAMNT_0010771005 /DNA_START=686 /DNA_END=1063 /DNA_ORIENTATION=+